MTDRDETQRTGSDPSFRERLTHSARIAMVALQRREDSTSVDRDRARRMTVARLHAGATA
jgi:hypothetical protein